MTNNHSCARIIGLISWVYFSTPSSCVSRDCCLRYDFQTLRVNVALAFHVYIDR